MVRFVYAALSLILVFLGPVSAASPDPVRALQIHCANGYLPGLPVLVRLELIDDQGLRDWQVWDVEAELTTDSAAVQLSTNRVQLRHGMGSTLVSVQGEGPFHLTAKVGVSSAQRPLEDWSRLPVTVAGGILEGDNTTWSGIVRLTNDLIIPFGHTLTIAPGALVLLDGVTSGVVATDIAVQGSIQSLGTAEEPVTITCAQADPRYRWGQIRHNNATASLYRSTTITRGGRAFGEGHTGTAPVIRALGSSIRFESCNLTDHAEADPAVPDFGQPGKILLASLGCDLVFDNCLIARARMGPEISATSLLLTNSMIMEMHGTNDSDGLFLDRQSAGQRILITHSVLAEGDDDGIDTLNADFRVEHCLIRGWRNPFEDSKGISVDGGEARLDWVLMVDNALGCSAKGGNAVTVRLYLDHCTILAQGYALGVTNKSGTLPIIEVRATNSILRGQSDSIFTQYDPADLRLSFCNVGEAWPGPGNMISNPGFRDPGAHDFQLGIQSPCIDSGDPRTAFDPDGSRTDMGFYVFEPPPPSLVQPQRREDGSFGFGLLAFPRRSYVIEASTNPPAWLPLFNVRAQGGRTDITDTNRAQGLRLYRARLAH